MEKSRASLLVTLVSSDQIAAVVTVGPDQSCRGYDAEAREFLRVPSAHVAGAFLKSDLAYS